jgi:hypothetical protein
VEQWEVQSMHELNKSVSRTLIWDENGVTIVPTSSASVVNAPRLRQSTKHFHEVPGHPMQAVEVSSTN